METILDRFNLFESLDLVRQEIRHSAFLRWLLDPAETHGQGDYWLRQILWQVIKAGEGIWDNAPSLFDLDGWDLGQAEVRKEWQHIDILILDEGNKFVCAIENKVDSGEAPGQLERYREILNREFGGYRRAFVFLTISGYPPDPPADETWAPMSYSVLASTIESALRRRESQISDEIKLFIQQYLDIVRRHIVEESEVQELCRRLYENHRRALEFIFENRPDRAGEVSQVVQGYIRSREDLIHTNSSKTYISFLPRSMDILPHEGTRDESKRILYWLLENEDERVRFKLEMGPGPQHIREQVYEKSKSLPKTFDGLKKAKLSPLWNSFFSETWITRREYNELGVDEIKQRVGERIDTFLERKGKAVAEALRELPCVEAIYESKR